MYFVYFIIVIINAIYRTPAGSLKTFKTYLRTFLNTKNLLQKHVYIIGDTNVDLLNHALNSEAKTFIDILLEYNLIPTINKATRVTKKSSTLLDNIITNNFHNSRFKTGIIKTDLTDHFPIFLISDSVTLNNATHKSTVFMRQINESSIGQFKHLLNNYVDWNLVLQSHDVNNAYDLFLNQFSKMYDKAFPLKVKVINSKSVVSPWMTKGLIKSSRKKQKLYDKYLKNKTYKNETNYKNYKNLFEKTKKRSKVNYYAKLLEKNKGNPQKTWSVIRDLIGKNKNKKNNLPQKLIIEGKLIYQKEVIIEKLNNFFLDVGPNLAAKIPNGQKKFDSYLATTNLIMEEPILTKIELHTAFNNLKKNKSAGIDQINVNVIKSVFDIIEPSLFHIFNLSLKSGHIPDKLKIAKITPIFKSGDETNISNYRPISVLPCFSKLIERIMYNRLYKYLSENKILYNNQYGFKKNHSTDHAIIELVKHISNGFNSDCYTIGVFIDLSKAFDTVNHKILLKKLENYGVKNQSLLWFKSYLTNRKQFILKESKDSKNNLITCGVPQGSILGPLLFLIYINDLYLSSKVLNTILFADDTNLFYSHKDITVLFKIFNEELDKINEWFISNRLSLNVEKTKFILFHKPSKAENIPLKLPNLLINNKIVKRELTTNFLGVLIDEKLSWKFHIKYIEGKISKNVAMLYRTKPFLNNESLKNLYFSFIHSYLSYCNIAWGSTNHTKLKKIYSKQKHACRIVFGANRKTQCEPLLRQLGALNIYKLNIHQVMLFMFKAKLGFSPVTFQSYFNEISHKYPTKFSLNNFVIPINLLKLSSYQIQYRGPLVWKKFLPIFNKKQNSALNCPLQTFKDDLKRHLLNMEFNILDFKYLF